jgi:MutS domain V
MNAPGESAELGHTRRRDAFAARAAELDAQGAKLSLVRLATFMAAVLLFGAAISRARADYAIAGAGAFLVFVAAVVLHARISNRRAAALVRVDVHDRHLGRIHARTGGLPDGAALVPTSHPYAYDLDVVGPGSLFQRISVAQTQRGQARLADWLSDAASRAEITERQDAVRELAPRLELRQELEAKILDRGADVLDPRPFLELAGRAPFVLARPWLVGASYVLPAVTLAVFLWPGAPAGAWLLPALLTRAVSWTAQSEIGERYALLSARRSLVESFRSVLEELEGARVEAPLLVRAHARLSGSRRPSVALTRLERAASFFDLRTQGLVHFFVDFVTMWDVHCLASVERWMRDHGSACDGWFDVIADFEALSSLAGMLHRDPGALMPEIAPTGAPLRGAELAHPLLSPSTRVVNDVLLDGPGFALVITGSNMAGKSTLLRAVGLNTALALAGGPVVARSFSVPEVRIRASMRIADSVQSGSSYFQAELARLKIVIGDADAQPPILFLLDELLRGTNARARHKGARAVVAHLLSRGAMGMVATHDVALSELEAEQPGHVRNVHFTDVFEGGEMTFDYKLRPGVVRTSNALRLLALAGVEVEADDELHDAPPALR